MLAQTPGATDDPDGPGRRDSQRLYELRKSRTNDYSTWPGDLATARNVSKSTLTSSQSDQFSM